MKQVENLLETSHETNREIHEFSVCVCVRERERVREKRGALLFKRMPAENCRRNDKARKSPFHNLQCNS